MTNDARRQVLNAHEYLLRLTAGESTRQFAGGDLAAWREGFRRWLCELLAAGGAPAVPEATVLDEQDWQGCRRVELLLRNLDSGLMIPATILQPRENRANGAGIVCQHGHGEFARLSVIGDRSSPALACEIEQFRYDYGLGLARAGYTIIAIDLLNFGSRAIAPLPDRDRCDVVGLWLSLCGVNLVGLLVDDIRHAVSALAAWEGVDPRRIGMCGLSTGGRMTMFAAAVDERIKVAVASGACNTFRDRIASLGGACGAQVVPGLLPHADTPQVFASIAPRPLQLQWGSQDPLILAEPAARGIAHIERCYAAAGQPERFDVHRFEGGHEFALQPALAWFERWL